jgi:hypothetical protein
MGFRVFFGGGLLMRSQPSLLVSCGANAVRFPPTYNGLTTSSYRVIPRGPVVFGANSGATFVPAKALSDWPIN